MLCSTVLELSRPDMASVSGGVMFLHGLWRFCLMFFASAGIGVVFGLVSTMISLSVNVVVSCPLAIIIIIIILAAVKRVPRGYERCCSCCCCCYQIFNSLKLFHFASDCN